MPKQVCSIALSAAYLCLSAPSLATGITHQSTHKNIYGKLPPSRLHDKHTTMAEMTLPQKSGKRKLQAPRIDLTPLVDLGFLLITFFMYTTTITKLKVMDITIPNTQPSPSPTPYAEESTITIILLDAHKIIYYEGALKNKEQLRNSSFTSVNGIRTVLLNKQKAAKELPATFSADAHRLHVIIKPADNCTYDDLVRILDEMNILSVPCYAMADLSAQERELLKK